MNLAEDRIHPLHRLALVVALAGLGLIAVGATLPWGDAGPGDTYGAFDHFGDGFLALACGVTLDLLLWRGGSRDSRTRTVQLLPIVLGVGTFLFTLAGFRSVEAWINSLEDMGQHPTMGAGLYVSLLGGGLAAIGGLTSSATTVRQVPVWRGEGREDAAFARDFLGRIVLGGMLAAVGAIAGALLGLQLSARLPNALVMLFFALIGGTVGAKVADRLWGRTHAAAGSRPRVWPPTQRLD